MWAVSIDSIVFGREGSGFDNVGQVWIYVLDSTFRVVCEVDEDAFFAFEVCLTKVCTDACEELTQSTRTVVHAEAWKMTAKKTKVFVLIFVFFGTFTVNG